MPYVLENLVVDRVDLVDEGANSAAFIELYKRKETAEEMTVEEILSKMKPEHAEVIKNAMTETSKKFEETNTALMETTEALAKVNDTLDSTKEELDNTKTELDNTKKELDGLKGEQECTCDGEADENGMCKECGRRKKANFDETETIKSMPENVRELFQKMKAQKEAAEEQIRKAKEAEEESKAIAKANDLKALPIEQKKLVGIIKSANTDLLDLLSAVNTAIEGTVLGEVGKRSTGQNDGLEAWDKIERKAEEIAKRDSISKAKAISVTIKEEPELYQEYLQGGAN